MRGTLERLNDGEREKSGADRQVASLMDAQVRI